MTSERAGLRCGFVGPGDTCSYDRGHDGTHSWEGSRPAGRVPAAGGLIGHTSECQMAMYRGPRVCICGAANRRKPAPLPSAARRCDQIVNNGEGEPTECGRTLPCERHPSAAREGEELVDVVARAMCFQQTGLLVWGDLLDQTREWWHDEARTYLAARGEQEE